MPMPKLSRVEAARLARAPEDTGRPVYLEGQEPTVGPLARGKAPAKNPKFTTGAVPGQYYGSPPFRSNGRLFMNFNGQAYTCSASVVPSKSHQVILTAGHCIFNRKRGFADGVAFIPGSFAGTGASGGWFGTKIVTTKQWVKKDNEKLDYAAIKVAGPQGKIGNVVGESGLALNAPGKKKILALGYPSNLTRSAAMWACISGLKGRDPFLKGKGKSPLAIGCNMSFGASGGSWEILRKKRWYVNSVTSYFYAVPRFRNILFGPYLTKKARKTIKKASR
jgi:hypothetical protein